MKQFNKIVSFVMTMSFLLSCIFTVNSQNIAYAKETNSTWTKTSAPAILNGIVYNNGKYWSMGRVYIPNNNGLYNSVDGVKWTKVKVSNVVGDIYGITLGNGKFVSQVYGKSKNVITRNVMVSVDGVKWSNTNLPKNMITQSIIFGNNKFILSADNSKGKTQVYTSLDGQKWTKVTDDLNDPMYSTLAVNGKYINLGRKIPTVSSDLKKWTSGKIKNADVVLDLYKKTYNMAPDTSKFNNVSNDLYCTFDSIAYGNNKYVASGGYYRDGIGVRYTAVSIDGENWDISNKTDKINNIVNINFANGKFAGFKYVEDSMKLYTSLDGEVWTEDSLKVERNEYAVGVLGCNNKIIIPYTAYDEVSNKTTYGILTSKVIK